MQAGKVPPDVLLRYVFPYTGRHRPDVLLRARIGEDSAAIRAGEWAVVLSTDPITGAPDTPGWYAVHVAANDLAASGAEPVGVLLTLLAPEGTEPEDIGRTMADADRAARELGIEILGGHTEILSGIDRLLLSTTAVGLAPTGRLVSSGGARAGDALILTKGAGIEGTAILASAYRRRLAAVVPEDVLERARGFAARLSVVPEGRVAAAAGATAMHDVTEGGVLGAVGELAHASGVGFVLDANRVSVAPETVRVCEPLGVDPLALIGSGAMLVAAPDGPAMVRALGGAGIPAAEVGRLTVEPRRLVRRLDQVVDAPEYVEDALWRAFRELPPEL